MQRRGPGRPNKGDRVLVRGFLPRPLADALKNEAARRGMTLTDLLGVIAAEATGVPYTTQEGLPISA